MKLASRQLHEAALATVNTERDSLRTLDDVSVRIYTSGKKAKRAARAMQRNGWAYLKSSLRPLALTGSTQQTRQAWKKQRKQYKFNTPATRMVVYFRR